MMNVCSNIFRFILPERVEFQKGWKQNTMLRKSLNASAGSKLEYAVIKYAEEERLLGVFRYPKTKDGGFCHPKTPEEIKKILELSEEKVQEMLRVQEVLTFEAFKIPIFSFEYFSVTDEDFGKIGKLVPGDISSSVRTTYESALGKLMSDVKTKIESLPNYLLILENILDLKYKDKNEIVEMTGNIIHFGI
jgi:hypothetical protein